MVYWTKEEHFDFADDIVLVSRRLSDIQFKSEDLDSNVDENEVGVRLSLKLVFNKKQVEIWIYPLQMTAASKTMFTSILLFNKDRYSALFLTLPISR